MWSNTNPVINSNKYLLVFVDDFSRMTWVYFVKETSDALHVFQKFNAYVEKQSGYELKTLCTDRGGEFTSKEFTDFCEKEGICKQLTTSYTPQQNGVAERKNKSLVEMTKSMLKTKNLPNSFWAEAVHTVTYILIRSPIRARHEPS